MKPLLTCVSFVLQSSAPASSPPRSASPPAAGPGTSPPGRCCDSGRPLLNPLTGQTVCSCQYDLFSYQRLAGAPLPPPLSYGAPYPEGMAAYFPALGADQSPFYTSAVSIYFSHETITMCIFFNKLDCCYKQFYQIVLFHVYSKVILRQPNGKSRLLQRF